jgi:flagellar FliL protein
MAKTLTASVAKPAAPAAADGPAKKKSPIKWIVLGLLIVAIGGGAGAWYYLRPAPSEGAAKAAEAKVPVFLNLEPFTVNLQEENGEHYLQVGIVYQVASDKVVDSAKVYMPVLRNRILLLLSAKRPSDLATAEGKSRLVAELIAAARESIPGSTPDRGVSGALLSAFVIQ